MMTTTTIPTLDYARIDERGYTCLLSTEEISGTIYREVNLSTKVFEERDMYLTDDEIETIGGEIVGSGTKLTPKENNEKSLLVVEMYFICKCIEALGTDKIVLIYIGGKPGDHINNLAELFPTVEFHIYNPVELPKVIVSIIDEEGNETVIHRNIVKHQEKFTGFPYDIEVDEKVILISSSRNIEYNSNPKTDEERRTNAKIIIEDMEEQKKWYYQIKPSFALLRFRGLKRKEALLAGRSSFSYMTGIHLLSPYSKGKTNTTMLMVKYSENQSESIYFDNDIMNRLKYHNITVRNGNIYLNPFTRLFQELISIDDVRATNIRFDLDKEHYVMNYGWDCRYVYFVFSLYLKFRRNIEPIKVHIDELILTHFSKLRISKSLYILYIIYLVPLLNKPQS